MTLNWDGSLWAIPNILVILKRIEEGVVKMKYVLLENTVARADHAPTSPIVNAYKKNTLLEVVTADSGWIETIDKFWIHVSDKVVRLEKWLRDNRGPIVYDPRFKTIRALGMRPVLDGEKIVGSVIKIHSSSAEDPTTGNTIYTGYQKAEIPLAVTGVTEEGYLKVTDPSNDSSFYVSPGDVQQYDQSNDKWTDVSASAVQNEAQKVSLSNTLDETAEEISGNWNTFDDMVSNMGTKNMRSVFGMPYQFLPQVDQRIDGSDNPGSFGRKFAQKIVSRMPILILQAGIPEFMKGYTEEQKKSLSNQLAEFGSELTDGKDIEGMVTSAGRYYTLKVQPKQYFNVVNKQCWAMANLLGLDKVKIDVGGQSSGGAVPLGQVNWWEVTNSLSDTFGYYSGAVSFYVNAEPQVSESFNNGTTQSQLAAKMNEIGRAGTELQFLMGGASNLTGIDASSMTKTDAKSITEGKTTGGVIDSIIGNIQTLLSGGRMMFPEIWSDSQLMRSFTVTIKLDTPDCDALSIYLNILVPLAHILGFVAPRSVGYNNYISPFLVRAYFKSMFHIDMGIITDCQIQKGDAGSWNQAGLPNQVTVTLTIKDLYDVMSVALNNDKSTLVSNPAQLDYLANLCGINIATPSIARSFSLWLAMNGKANLKSGFLNSIRGGLTSIYSKWYNLFTTSRSDYTM